MWQSKSLKKMFVINWSVRLCENTPQSIRYSSPHSNDQMLKWNTKIFTAHSRLAHSKISTSYQVTRLGAVYIVGAFCKHLFHHMHERDFSPWTIHVDIGTKKGLLGKSKSARFPCSKLSPHLSVKINLLSCMCRKKVKYIFEHISIIYSWG